VDLSHDVDSVDDQRGLSGHAQGDVQYGAILRDVDVLASEHAIAALAQSRLVRQIDEQTNGLVGDALLRIVQVESLDLGA
jgi:hypothetical protein